MSQQKLTTIHETAKLSKDTLARLENSLKKGDHGDVGLCLGLLKSWADLTINESAPTPEPPKTSKKRKK
jgi:hypothetical protein